VSQAPEAIVSTEPVASPPAEPEAVMAPVSAEAPPASEVAAAEPAVVAAPTVQESLPDNIDVPPGMIRISRSKIPDDRGTRLMDAYAAWQAGDRDESGRLYREVLENYPGNRDALLGLAAIALSGDDTDTASQHYASVLAANPGDELATAALIGLEREADPVSRESALKVLIQEYPERPYLHFNLGNVFAAGRRWAEAQQAFFDAYRLDPLNPDYANNLAVSLDRIGQYETAVDYYLTALDLAKTRAAKFSEAGLLARIQQLENHGRP
jgi:tetratricopeptide (TPR) repeat protein